MYIYYYQIFSGQFWIFPFLISATENIVSTSNGSSHHFPNTEYLVVFIKTNILQHIQKRRTLMCKNA